MAYSGAFRLNREQEEEAVEKLAQDAPTSVSREKPSRIQDKLSGTVEVLMRKLDLSSMETDDLIMALILYLMYRESGDKDLLIMLGAMFLS